MKYGANRPDEASPKRDPRRRRGPAWRGGPPAGSMREGRRQGRPAAQQGDAMVLPNFICVGAEKAGTTPLFRILAQHRDIFMPPYKEAHWFSRFYLMRQRITYEASHFQGWRGQKAVGEATPEYMRTAAVPARLKRDLGPGLKLIFCLRDPVKRAHSHYLQCVRLLEEGESFPNAIARELQRGPVKSYLDLRRAYIGAGRYARHIKRYLECFPREQMHILLFEQDFLPDRRKAVADVLEFLEVAPDPKIRLAVKDSSLKAPVIRVVGEAPPGAAPRRVPPGTILFRTGNRGADRTIPNPSPQARAYFLKLAKNMTRTLTPKMDVELYRRFFVREIDALETLLDRDLSDWRR